jgi:hypothetical protein
MDHLFKEGIQHCVLAAFEFANKKIEARDIREREKNTIFEERRAQMLEFI